MSGYRIRKYGLAPQRVRSCVTLLCIVQMLIACQTPTSNTIALTEVIVPEIHGKVHRSGEALPGVVIKVALNEGLRSVCERPIAETVTDEQGVFKLVAIDKQLVATVPDRIENDWQVCMEDSASVRQLWYDSHVGVLTGQETTELDCNISRAGRVNSAFCEALNAERRSSIPDD